MAWTRFGGELPADCDPRLSRPTDEDAGVLLFSHGRAALDWLVTWRRPVSNVLLCAYTCPSVPQWARRRGFSVSCFDSGASIAEIAAQVRVLARQGRVLVLVPALFGLDPWLNPADLASILGEQAVMVVDAAQTAFGHRRYPIPPGGAVLSCPRKTTALADGACLAVEGVDEGARRAVAALPEATGPTRAKARARALFAAREIAKEAEALALVAEAEAGWPDQPHRMSSLSAASLPWLDAGAHACRRCENRAVLRQALGPGIPAVGAAGIEVEVGGEEEGVPFAHAILVDDRAALLARLRAQRIFATPLWPDAEHDPAAHPRAALLARRLVLLPVDQRYCAAEMRALGHLVRESLS